MTDEQREAEYQRFLEAYPDRTAIPRVTGFSYPQCDGWMRRAAIARAEQAELRAEIERLRAENAELRERLTVDDLDELERYRVPPWPSVPSVRMYGGRSVEVDGMVISRAKIEPMPYPLDEIAASADELDQLRAAAAELAEIHKVWRLPKGV